MQLVREEPRRKISTTEKKKSGLILFKIPRIIDRDGRYAAYDNGIVCDCYSGMEWLSSPDEDTNWPEAHRWAKHLKTGGGGWQLATIEQLKSLYCRNKNGDRITPLLAMQATDVWSSDVYDEASAWGFNFIPGNAFRTYRTYKNRFRALAIRQKPQYRR